MVTTLALLGVLGVLFVAAVLATKEGGELAPAPPDVADLDLPARPLAADDVAALRFPMAARGYRMAEVDVALERLAEELRDRDRRIGLLEAAAEGQAPSPGEATPHDLPLPPQDTGPVGAPPPAAGH